MRIGFLLLGLSLIAIVQGGDVLDISSEDEADIEIVGIGDDCDNEKSVCDKKSHLVCSVERECVCDPGLGWHYSFSSKKCEKFIKHGNNKQNNKDHTSEEDYPRLDYDDEGWSMESDETGSSNETSSEEHWPMDENETDWKLADIESKDTNKGQVLQLGNQKEGQPSKINESIDIPAPIQSQGDKDNIKNDTPEVPSESKTVQSEIKDVQSQPSDEAKEKDASQNDSKDVKEEGKIIGDISIRDDEPSWEADSDESYQEEFTDEDQVKIQPRTDSEDSNVDPSNIECKQSATCIDSKLGKFSRCNTETETCECFDTEEKGRELSLFEGKCYTNKEINEPCTNHNECNAGIQHAWCHTDLNTNTSYCTCEPFHLWEPELKKCLPYALSLESPCKRDGQCSAEEALGPHARCSEVTEFCECSNALASEVRNIIFFDGKCQPEKDINETCKTDQECEASLGPFAICSPITQSCTCQEGHPCHKSMKYSFERPEMSSFTMLVLVVLGAVILIGGVLCLVIKKSDSSYSFIQQHNEV